VIPKKRKCFRISILLRYDMSLYNRVSPFPDNIVLSTSWVKMPMKNDLQKKLFINLSVLHLPGVFLHCSLISNNYTY
jgi:hypothetical protein